MKLHKFISMNKVIISSFLAIGILLGCNKKEQQPDLPPITSTGENTFGCYIDGEPYAIFEGTPNPWKITFTKFSDAFNNGLLKISVQNENPRWWIDIRINNPDRSTGTFIASNGFPFYSEFLDHNQGSTLPIPSSLFKTTPTHYLTIEITKAQDEKHYGSTFSGEMHKGEGKVNQITDGRFDFKK